MGRATEEHVRCSATVSDGRLKGMHLASEPSEHSEGPVVLGSHLLAELEQTESALSLYPSRDSAEASCSR